MPIVPLRSGRQVLGEAESRYLCSVHRLEPGDGFEAFDPEQRVEAPAELVKADTRAAECEVGALSEPTAVLGARVVLVQAIGKGDSVDRVVRDATALGVAQLVLVESRRTVVRLGDRAEARRDRWRSIAVQAARQCGRGDVPDIDGPADLEHVLPPDRGSGLVLDPRGGQRLHSALDSWDVDTELKLVIGPEGGWAPEEMARLEGRGFEPTRFGALVLRTETAATAALGAVVARLDALE